MNKWLIAAILLGAFLIRFIGLGYGLPHQLVGDEYVQVAIALKMLDAKALTPNFPTIFYHQPLSAYISTFGIGSYLAWQYLTGTFANLADLKTYYSIHSSDLIIVPRFLSVLLNTLTILLLYYIGRDLFNRRVGLLAAFFAAFDLALVFVSHTGRVWSYMPIFIALSLWASVKLYQQESWKNYLKVAGATLLAAANLLPGLFTFVPVFVSKFNFRNKKLWASIGIIFVGTIIIIAMSPRGLGALFFRFQSFSGSQLVEKIAGQPVEYQVAPVSLQHRIFDTFLTLLNFSPVYLLLFLVGSIFLWKEDRKKFWFLISFPIAYYLFIGPFFTFGWVVRALGPIVIYLVLLSAYAVDKILSSKFSNRPILGAALILLVSAPSVFGSNFFDYRLLKTDSRLQAFAWVAKNLPADSKILVYALTGEMLNQDRGVFELLQKIAPNELTVAQRTLLSLPSTSRYWLAASPLFYAWNLRDIGPEKLPKDFFKKNQFQYFLVTNWNNEVQKQFESDFGKLLSSKKLIASFSPFAQKDFSINDLGSLHNMNSPLAFFLTADRFGPEVNIYEVKFK